MIHLIIKWLSYPDTRGLDIDDPRVTFIRWKILKEKQFLHRVYLEWYMLILKALSEENEPILEIGSGAGFSREINPKMYTSEVFFKRGFSGTG